MQKILKIGLGLGLFVVVMAGSTHIWMPTDSDQCQRDISHIGHLWSLPPFHCLGHSEFYYDTDADGSEVMVWDHRHSWMTISWFLEQGFSAEEATSYVIEEKD